MPEAERIFTGEDTWSGGFYELVVQLGNRDDEKLDAALRRIWSFPLLEGCYLNRRIEPSLQERVEPSLALALDRHLLGVAKMQNDKRVACGTYLLPPEQVDHDWLGFYVPMTALGQVYEVGAYPFGPRTFNDIVWQHQVDSWLSKLGTYVFEGVPFRLGLIGHEVLGDVELAERLSTSGVPKKRYAGYLVPRGGTLSYFAVNRWHGGIS